MADFEDLPEIAALKALAAAPARLGKLVKLGTYKFHDGQTGFMYVHEKVLREPGTAIREYKPRLKPGIDPNKPKFAISDFEMPRRKMLFEPAEGSGKEPFRFDPKTHEFHHGGAYGGPINDNGLLHGRLDSVCYQLLHWIRDHVETLHDLFQEDRETVNRLKTEDLPIPRVEDKTYDDLEPERAEGRPISLHTPSTRAALMDAPVIHGAQSKEVLTGAASPRSRGTSLSCIITKKSIVFKVNGFPDAQYVADLAVQTYQRVVALGLEAIEVQVEHEDQPSTPAALAKVPRQVKAHP